MMKISTGGTIAEFSQNGTKVSILEVSGHLPPLYENKDFEITQKEALRAFKILGVHNYEFLKIPATMVHTLPVSEINKKIEDFINKIAPEIVLIPFPDRHIDHRTIFDASVVLS